MTDNVMSGEERKYKLTLTDEFLGTSPADAEVYETYIADQVSELSRKEEIEHLGKDAYEEKGMTVFMKDEDGVPLWRDYQIRGFFKEAARFCKKIPGSITSKAKAYIQEIDGLIMVEPKWIPIKTNMEITKLQRPLRAQTAQGPRIALSNSEMIEPGCTLEFTVRCLNPIDFKLVEEWLTYGQYHGLGQWRNSGCGRFTWEEIKE